MNPEYSAVVLFFEFAFDRRVDLSLVILAMLENIYLGYSTIQQRRVGTEPHFQVPSPVGVAVCLALYSERWYIWGYRTDDSAGSVRRRAEQDPKEQHFHPRHTILSYGKK